MGRRISKPETMLWENDPRPGGRRSFDPVVHFADKTPEFKPVEKNTPGWGQKYVRFVEALRARPGKWAQYPGSYVRSNTNVYNIAYHINSGRRPTLPPEEFEARVDVDNTIWVRAKPKPRKPRR